MPNKFKTLLPPNAIPQERALEQATIEEVLSIPDLIRIVKNPALCPVELLPWLAWEYSVDTWNTDWTEEEKRAAIARAAYIHRHRGTRAAIEMSLSSSPFASDVVEWFEKTPRGEPYTFSLDVTQDDRPITLTDVQDLKSAVMKGKNLRSWFDVSFKGRLDGKAILAGYMIASESIVILQAFELFAVHVNGWTTSEFIPTTSFSGAVYTMIAQGNFGPITWRATGPATVASDGTVTISGPGYVSITGTDGKGRTITHAITPARYFIPSPEQMLQTDMPAFITANGGRMPHVSELTTDRSIREAGALWNEWGNLGAFGWREWRSNNQMEEEVYATDTPGTLPNGHRFVRIRSGVSINIGTANDNKFSVAAVIDLEKK
ncbi:phage tail protein I [Serratia liquefaciens]|uniref:phage tail protein I n=1 Tax=Serratia liquefaciens TaxID=614 RepID=UPI002361BE1F|nr:phage tail protein I [Serratia liquefaciens]